MKYNHWHSHKGALGACHPLRAYSVTQNSAKIHPNRSFSYKKMLKFSGGGGGIAPPQTPSL